MDFVHPQTDSITEVGQKSSALRAAVEALDVDRGLLAGLQNAGAARHLWMAFTQMGTLNQKTDEFGQNKQNDTFHV